MMCVAFHNNLIINIKISSVQGLTVDSLRLTFLPTSKSRDTKTTPNIKNLAGRNLGIVPWFKNPWSVASSCCKWRRRADSFWKWLHFQLWRARNLELDLGSGHTAYRRASFIDLYLQAKFHLNRRNFLWADGRTHARTYGRTDWRTFETGFIRSTLSKSRPKYQNR